MELVINRICCASWSNTLVPIGVVDVSHYFYSHSRAFLRDQPRTVPTRHCHVNDSERAVREKSIQTNVGLSADLDTD
eukprot:6628536-Pyramimonas_sp.AAC.1